MAMPNVTAVRLVLGIDLSSSLTLGLGLAYLL